MTPEQAERARELRKQGVTVKDLATRFGVSTSSIYYHLTDAKVRATRPKPRRLSEDEIATIQRMRREGESPTVIAAEFGVSPETVGHWTRHNEPARTPPTKDELLLSAYPWAYRLPLPMRERFGHELSHRPSYEYEHQLDAFILRWRNTAEQYRRSA